jgi:hypothetical protein
MATSNEGSSKTGSASQNERPKLSRDITVDESKSPSSVAKGTLLCPPQTRHARLQLCIATRHPFHALSVGHGPSFLALYFTMPGYDSHECMVSADVLKLCYSTTMSYLNRDCDGSSMHYAMRNQQHGILHQAVNVTAP